MFKGFSQQTIDFMWNIRLNNNKPWFEEHKSEYINDLLTPMKELAQDVFEKISSKYENHGFNFKVSRIYKDARRARGDGRYKENLWFTIEKPSEIWTNTPVFWFELTPENWHYGLGFYHAKPETMAKLRSCIDQNPKEFEKLIKSLEKQNEFVLEGEEYKRKKIPPTEEISVWYNKKSFSLIHFQKNSDELFSPELVSRLVNGYEFLMPFYNYFNLLTD